MTSDDLPQVETAKELEPDKLARLNFNDLWGLCGGQGAASDEFTKEVQAAMRNYRPGPDQRVRIPAKDRTKHYKALEKAITSLRVQFEDMHPHIDWELAKAAIEHEPEDFAENSIGKWYEGLSYSEYLADLILEQLAQFSNIVRDAREYNNNPRGKPKQNLNL
ncbi:hypothetical protein [Roseovarius sp. MMSF_3281]|uniref:hypothetical protein n=1 Tax=Roseovarius sp. MMSF_3281 TaxID=3046694 RepID=UPI00273D91B7|nr:hypothetical protein [Roseovarius sp. MMSF_3281]